MLFWVFASTHYETYLNTLPKWNQENPDKKVQMHILNGQVLERRMVSGFFSGTPLADVFEIERGLA